MFVGDSGGGQISMNGPGGLIDYCIVSGSDGVKTSAVCAIDGVTYFDRIRFQGISGTEGAAETVRVYDVWVNPVSLVTPEQTGGPCRMYCDYSAEFAMPLNDTLLLTPVVWNLSVTSSLNTLEGTKLAWANHSNIYVTTTNGTATGTCSGFVTGNITSVERTAASLLVNYTYGNTSTTNCAMTPPKITLCFNGTNQVYTYAVGTDTSWKSDTYDMATVATKYYHYNLTYRYEGDNQIWWHAGGVHTLNSQYFCRNTAYEPFPITIPLTINNTIVQTRTPADVVTTLDGSIIRTNDFSGDAMANVYLPNWTMMNEWVKTPIQLNDLTGGQYAGSNLQIETNVNNSLQVVNNDTFDTDGLQYVWLKNNSIYKLTIISLAGTRVSGASILALNDGAVRKVGVSTPIIYNQPGFYGTSSIGWTSDYATSQIGAVVTTTDQSLTSNFTVKNASTSNWTILYSTTSVGATTFTYTVPSVYSPYYVELYLNSSAYGTQKFSRMFYLVNSSSPMNGTAFDESLPTSYMGASVVTLKKIFALVLSLFALYISCKASSYGVGSIIGVGTYAMFWYVNWIPHSEVPFWFIMVQMSMCGLLAITERRYS